MTLLDRFRVQAARHKHPDWAVRLAYVEELPLDEREIIAATAREDADPRVRRAAVAKLLDPAALGAIAQDDADESVRAQAAAMLRDIALEAFEGTGEADSLEAVDALSDVRTLAQIAKAEVREIVALRALSRVSDPHILGSTARHAAVEAARRGAFERLRGHKTEILAIAMNSEFKDTALAAAELITDRAELEQIAAGGKNKSAVKRARGVIREAEERAAREAADEVAAAEAAAAGARVAGPPVVPLAAGHPPASTDAGTGGPGAAEAEAEGVRAAQQEAARQREEQQAAERARRQAAADEATRHAIERRQVRLAELADEAAAGAADPDLTSARRRVSVARREWRDLASGLTVDAAVASRYDAAEAQLASRDAEAQEADARARRDALGRLQQLLGRVEPLVTKPELSLKAAERAQRDVKAALAAVPPLPVKQDVEAVTQRLKAALAALAPKVQELRETDDWQRWANVGIQEQLCGRMEALRILDDLEAVARDVHELQQQWRQAAAVPPARADALWRRFKAAHDEAWTRCEAHFAAQAHERAQNLARKTAICEQVESLADSTSWIQTGEAIKQLQAEWKTIGPASRGRERAIWDRFRTACDRFFTRRHEDLAQRKALWAENLARKEALCTRAEALAESSDWDQAAGDIKRLQAEWKTVGPVKKTRSEAIWQRFRAACDRFFLRYTQRHDIARAERITAREAVCAELEALSPPEGQDVPGVAQDPPGDLLATVRALRGRWQQEIAARGVDPEQARALDARFAAAFARVVARWPAAFSDTDLDPDANRKRMESLVRRVEELVTSLVGPAQGAVADAALSPTTRLAAMLKEALAANTIGGKVDDDSRWRAAAEDVRQAQANWSRLGPVPDDIRRKLSDRFQRACRQIIERAGGPETAAGPGRAGAAGQARKAGAAGR